jgi:hypothetical protein
VGVSTGGSGFGVRTFASRVKCRITRNFPKDDLPTAPMGLHGWGDTLAGQREEHNIQQGA